jgi:hypothetical protein
MGLLRPKLVTIVTTALVAALLSAAPVSARSDAPREDRRGGNHFPASVTTEVPPGGYSTITSPTIPKDTKALKVTLEAESDATQDEVQAFDQLAQTFGKMTKGQRLLTCIMIYNFFVTASSAGDDYGTEVQFNVNTAQLAGAVLLGCIRLAGLLTSSGPAKGAAVPLSAPLTTPKAKMRRCVQDKPGVPGTLEQAGDGSWTLSVDGTLEKTRNKLKVGCRTKSGKTVLTVRAAKKGVPLRKVLGKQPRLALVSPADAEVSAPTTVTFSLP